MEVSSIISEDQYLDYSNSVDALISEMREAYKSNGIEFGMLVENIPRRWKSPKFLVCHNILDPKLLFISSFGMKQL